MRKVGFLLASTGEAIIGAVGVVISAAVGAAGVIISARVRHETTQPRRRTTARSPATPAAEMSTRLSVEVEGYLVRFLLLYLVLAAWSAVINVANPFFFFGSFYIDVARGVVYSLIFVFLGAPLLWDIARRYHVRGTRRASDT
jgi:hypothetical protein